MILPTRYQIETIATELAKNLGGGVHITPSHLAQSVDAAFSGMTDVDYEEVAEVCYDVATEVRSQAISDMWS